MRSCSPFQRDDLDELDAFLSSASRVRAMEDIAFSNYSANVIGMRHDVDNALAPAVAMAQWEAERGYRSTYFILHTAPYWQDKDTLQAGLEVIADCGHEIGFHVNAIAEAIRTGMDPLVIATSAIAELRSYGHEIHGVVPHGDPLCHVHNFVNDELFKESPRPKCGEPDRYVAGVKLQPIHRRTLGFDYDPNWLPRLTGVSDSGGQWSQPFDELAAGFPYAGQIHMLIHPEWWAEALIPAGVAA